MVNAASPPRRLAVMASGRGSLLQAIISSGVPLQLVVADQPCPALSTAQAANIPTTLVDRRDFGFRPQAGENWQRQAFTQQICLILQQHQIDLIAMAGFFTVLHADIFNEYLNRILNIHPALLPAFPGATAVSDALAARVSQTGTTIHLATPIVDDASSIIAQVKVNVHPHDTVDSLWERIKHTERQLYPEIINQIMTGAITLPKSA